MTPDELRAIMDFLRNRVQLRPKEGEGPAAIAFQAPTEDEMTRDGLNAEGSRRILGVPWWDEMVEDIVETPEMCDPNDPPEQVLGFARDVVSEYIRKRFPLEGDQGGT
jgi:hypothetical protein